MGLGVILTVTTTFCLLFGLLIVTVAMCKLNTREPWVVAMKRTIRGSTAAASDPGATPDANGAAAPDAVGFELMDKSKPKKVLDLEKGGSSAAESPAETVKRLNAAIAFLKQEIERVKEDNQKMQKVEHDNKDLQRKHESAVLRIFSLEQANEQLRRENEILQSGHLEDKAVTPDKIAENALVEAPATAEDIELQVTTEHQSQPTAVEAPASDHSKATGDLSERQTKWNEVRDGDSGKVYYHNLETKEARWDRDAQRPRVIPT